MRNQLLSVVCMLGLVACSQENNQNTAANVEQKALQNEMTDNSADLVARIKGMPVQQTMIDEEIALKLYDLEWAKYELRRTALSKLVDNALASGRVVGKDVEVLMAPPLPPRIELPDSTQPSIGNNNAPVTIAVFCSYQSTHCTRMQPVYDALATQYGEQVRFVFYDYSLAFHHDGPQAANAARCAAQAGQYAAFHKALWAHQDALNTATFERLASQLELPMPVFKECLKQGTFSATVKAEAELAQGYGFVNVPVTLINGLYLSGPKTVDTLRYFVDHELARKGIRQASVMTQSEPKQIALSKLPLRVEGVVLSAGKGASVAMIRHIESDTLQAYHEDDPLLDQVFVVMIEADRVIIENAGQLESLPLQTGGSTLAAAPHGTRIEGQEGETRPSESLAEGESLMSEEEISDEIRMAAESRGFSARPIVAAEGETPLSRRWLEDQLQNQAELQQHFKPAELEIEGVNVMKLRDVNENEFYQTLGLLEDDVVLRVNDEWVHSAQNNLFSKLENEREVSVVLMRKGLPVHLRYAIN